MDELAKKTFDSIVSKDISALTQSDIIFLRARQSYLTEEQLKLYSPYFDLPVATPVVTNRVDEVLKERKEKMFDDFTYRELQEKLKELGYKKVVGLKREAMIKMIEDSYAL